MRFRRAVGWLEAKGYFLPKNGGLRTETPIGDSVEIVARRRPSRRHASGLYFRASARFCEAARLSAIPNGQGFESIPLAEYLGLPRMSAPQ